MGATSGGLEEDVKLRDSEVPRLQPEQQIRLEEEVQTPPRREPRRNEGHDGRVGAGSGGPGGPAKRYSWSEPTKQRMVTRGGIGRYSVLYAARSRGVTEGKPIFEDAEGTSARAPGTTGGTYDNKGTRGGGTIRFPVPQNAMMNLRKSPMDMNTNQYEKLIQVL